MPLSKRLPAFLGKRAVKRSLIGVAAFLLLYSLLGFVALPAIVKSQLESRAASQLQRTLTVGKVEINPFALTLRMQDLQLRERDSDTVFASLDALAANLSTQSLLRLAPVVQELRLAKPFVRLVHQDAHRYNIDDILDLLASQPPSDEPARFSLYNIQVEDGRIEFEDKPAGATHTVSELKLGIPFISSLPSQVDVFVEPLFSAKVNGAPLAVQGKARPFANPADATMEFALDDLDMTRYLGYLPIKLQGKIPAARLDLKLTARFQQPRDKAPALLLDGSATLKALSLVSPEGKSLLKLPELGIELRNASVFGDQFEIARLRLQGLQADLAREADGSLNLSRLLPATPPAAAPSPTRAKRSPGASGMRITLGEVEIRDASLGYSDAYGARPMQAGVEKLDLRARKVLVDTGRKTLAVAELVSEDGGVLLKENLPAEPKPAPLAKAQAPANGGEAPYTVRIDRIAVRKWSARLEDHSHAPAAATTVAPLNFAMEGLATGTAAAPTRVTLQATVNKTGQVSVQGTLGFAPFETDLALDVKGVDILPLQPYIADRINLRLTRASLTANGKLQLRTAEDGLKGGFKGDITLGNLATVDKASGNDFLRWKSLHAGGVDMQVAPFALTMDQLALSDFFSRIIIDPSGRINLQDILRGEGESQRSLTEAASGKAGKAAKTRTSAPPRQVASAESAAPAALATPATPAAQAAMPPITIRKLTLQGGRVRFTDNFIRPNYSATLADIGGIVNGLSSDPASRAGVELHGLVNNAPLAIAGSINPLRGDLFLDLKANVRGMELAPLSAYSGRYVGYGIEKGKLSFEVAYRVDKRQLGAENRLILDQLTFGDPVESTTATKLPVQFAVALLRDRNGVIDINLPIAGSLDDPEFSVGGIIVRLLVNAVTKAISQPFALLGTMFGGGGAELSSIALDAGRAAVPPSGEEKLRSLAKALNERPALKLDITGRIDPEADRAGLKRVSVERKVRAVKLGDMRARGETPEPGKVVVGKEEYAELLKRAYRDEKFPKPRNLIGLPKDLPVEEMEKLMMDNADIDEDDLIALGNQRAQSVKNWLMKNGQVPEERLFLLAPKTAAPETRGKETVAGHRVDFALR